MAHTVTEQKARASTRRSLAAWVFAAAVLAESALIVHRWWEGRGAEIKDGLERLDEARAFSNRLTLVPDPASDPAISPDGKVVAFRGIAKLGAGSGGNFRDGQLRKGADAINAVDDDGWKQRGAGPGASVGRSAKCLIDAVNAETHQLIDGEIFHSTRLQT